MSLNFAVKYAGDYNPYYNDVNQSGITRTISAVNVVSCTPLFGYDYSVTIPSYVQFQANTNPNTLSKEGFAVIDTTVNTDPNLTMGTTVYHTPGSGGITPNPVTLYSTASFRTGWKGSLLSLDPYGAVYLLIHLQTPRLSEVTMGQHCASDAITLQAYIWGVPSNQDNITYRWYYTDPVSNSAVLVGSSVTNTFTFTPNQNASLMAVINRQTTNFNLGIYCIASTNADVSSASVPFSVGFSPPAPSVASFTPLDACANTPTGGIVLNGVTGMGNYAYVVVPATAGPCDPRNPSTCTSVESSNTFSTPVGGSYTIPNVHPGSYNLLIANNGGAAGACRQSFPVTIIGAAPLSLNGTSHTNISCSGGSNGSITVSTTGGKAGTVSYQLISQPSGTVVATQTTGVFSGLPAGNYVVSVRDGCGQGPMPPFTLTEPTRVTGSFLKTDADCLSPGDGSVSVTVSQGSGTYNYYLYLNGGLVGSQLNTTSTSWGVTGLGGGSYSLQVLDANASGCPGYAATVTIGAPPAMSLGVTQQTNLTCNGISTGSITLQGGGGMGVYNYTIANTTIGQSYTNTTGVFTALAAGSYTAMVQSAVSGCSDQYTYPQAIVVSQPQPIGIVAGGVDVRCYGLQNGSITAILSGGTGALVPVWQQQDGSGNWGAATGVVSGTTLSGLSPGVYRVSVTDANSCSKTSSPVAIAEPAVLAIPSVGMTDIVCYGGSGSITPVATGGNGGNVFGYSTDGGASYAAFVPGSAFGAGSYLLQVTDSKGCSAGYATAQVITAPPSALTFTDALSDYNGYNVTCYGATTGIVTVSAGGGNGSVYSGYGYSVDGGSYGAGAVLSGLAAGSHTIRVQDGRGCVVARSETLLQPASQLVEMLVSKKDNDCVDGQAGVLSVAVSGGTAPYQFSRNGGVTYQSGGDFSGLRSGNYTITARDQNGCSLGNVYSVVSLNPPLAISQTVQAVQCNGGSDGSVTLSVSGGVSPYSYQWSALSGTTAVGGTSSTASSLGAGVYVARVTDGKGCTTNDTATIGQPAALAAQLAIRPLCSDATGGRVTIAASGGTPPYQYSSDGGVSYQTSPAFTNLPAGSHSMVITDSHGCNWSQGVTIVTNTLVPAVDFLVSTRQNALDTLQVEDISSPKPDSVQWSFDTATLLLGYSPLGPLIRYTRSGTYPASMRAYYGGCDFSTAQNILIQPFDTNSLSPMVRSGLSIDTARLAPNPNSGTFNLYVKLFKAQRLVMTVTSLAGQPIYRKQWDGQQIISEQVNLPSNIPSGAYIVELVTETDVRDYNIIVTK